MNSLTTRLLVANLLVLTVFVGLTGLALQQAVYSRAFSAERERIQGLLYGVLGAADVVGSTLEVNAAELPEPRLRTPDSGVYALVLDQLGEERWRSPSYVDAAPRRSDSGWPEVGQWRFDYSRNTMGERLQASAWFELTFTIRWLSDSGTGINPARYYVIVMTDAGPFEQGQADFRRTLWAWLVVSALLLIVVQLLLLRWGLLPLRRAASEVQRIESGESEQLRGNYPSELAGLVTGLNGLLAHEKRLRARHRNALGDLAHSLKTPLAVLRATLSSTGGGDDARIAEQIERMDQIVRYQLGLAATAGRQGMRKPSLLRPVIERVTAALSKVYRDRRIRFTISCDAGLQVRADEEDLLELLGNLLDNAAKHCRQRVAVVVDPVDRQRVSVVIDDDGPGFPPAAERLLERGARADSRHAGQGIGLAASAEIVDAYDGVLALSRSSWGGGRITVKIG